MNKITFAVCEIGNVIIVRVGRQYFFRIYNYTLKIVES
jgi:hypothetical protein